MKELWDGLHAMIYKSMVDRFQRDLEGQEAMERGEPVLMGGLTNGFIQFGDGRIFFLPMDPMRQFRSNKEIGAELEKLIPEFRSQFKKTEKLPQKEKEN